MRGWQKKAVFFVLFLLAPSVIFAQERRINGAYFSIYYQTGLTPLEIARQIDFSSSHLLKEIYSSNPEVALVKTVDALFLEVSDILDIHLYSFKGNLRIFRDFQAINTAFYGLYRHSLKTPSFYVYDTNTIYIAADNLRVGILGHEIAHAIINHYFVVSPPVKIQEVLAGYVEYQLNKKMK
jgi:hypothetical protein